MSFFTVVHDGQLIGLSSLAGRYISTRIDGKGVFCRQDDPYSYEAEGENYFDMKRQRLIGDGHLVAFGDGDAVTVSPEAEAVRFLLVSGKPIGEPIA